MMVGIVSEKDLINAMLQPDCWDRPVRDVMKTNVVSYEEDTPVKQIYDFLCRVSIRQVVIVKDGIPTGAISRGALIRWFSHWVETRPTHESATPDPVEASNPRGSQATLTRIAHQMVEHATAFADKLQENVDDLTPHVVGSASRMQELVNDLLAFSRFANEDKGAASSAAGGLAQLLAANNDLASEAQAMMDS